MASPRRECLARRSSEALVQAKPWHGLVAGCIAGASGVVIGHAFDTAKVQAQVSSGSDSSTSSSSKPRALRSVLSLYRGIVPPLLSTGAVRSLYFGVYETFKPLVSTAMGKDSTSLPVVFIAGAMTGAVIAPVTAPVQRLKIMQQVEGGSLQEVCKRLLASGASGLFRGLAVHCVLETIGSGCYLLARDTYASGGLLAFYRGLGFTMLRAAPVAGTVLPVYDLCKAWLAAAAERSGSR